MIHTLYCHYLDGPESRRIILPRKLWLSACWIRLLCFFAWKEMIFLFAFDYIWWIICLVRCINFFVLLSGNEKSEEAAGPESLRLEDIREGISIPRNRALVYAFTYMNMMEHWGSGIPRIFRRCRELGLDEPELLEIEPGQSQIRRPRICWTWRIPAFWKSWGKWLRPES